MSLCLCLFLPYLFPLRYSIVELLFLIHLCYYCLRMVYMHLWWIVCYSFNCHKGPSSQSFMSSLDIVILELNGVVIIIAILPGLQTIGQLVIDSEVTIFFLFQNLLIIWFDFLSLGCVSNGYCFCRGMQSQWGDVEWNHRLIPMYVHDLLIRVHWDFGKGFSLWNLLCLSFGHRMADSFTCSLLLFVNYMLSTDWSCSVWLCTLVSFSPS